MQHLVKRTYDDEPLHVAGLADEIAYRLRTEILDGKLPGGTRLPHEELAARFRVSRTPIREALRQLQALNLLIMVPNRGATVRVPSRAEVKEAYELRAELEGFACELVCGRASDAQLRELDERHGTLCATVAAAHQLPEHQLDAAISIGNDAFHGWIHRIARNGPLADSIARLQGLFPRNSVWRAIAHDPAALRRMNVDEHASIVASLRARRAKAARKAMHDHVHGAGETWLAHLDEQGFWS